jgi:hypothetical protein
VGIVTAKREENSVMCSFKIRHSLVATLCMLGLLTCAAHAVGSEASYISFEVPGALGTYPMSVNTLLEVTGYYNVSPTAARGFVREADGTITTFYVAGAFWTEPESINAAGDITGFYELVSGVPLGFLRYADGRIITSDAPVSGLTPPQAMPVSMNDFDEAAGNYPGEDGHSSGFTRSRAGGFTTFVYAVGSNYPTVVTGLNASGSVVGYFAQDSGTSSFIQHPDGFWTQFDVPVDVGTQGILKTNAESINADGVIAGWYFAVMSRQAGAIPTTGGFARSPQGIVTLFDPPGTIVTSPESGFTEDGGSLSAPHQLSINQAGTITGSYTDAEGAQHGFVRNPYGTITSFDPPRGKQTTATSINDGGVIAGSYYYDWNTRIAQGFLRVPKP